MLDDRWYMRGASPARYRSATTVLIVANAVFFFLSRILDYYAPSLHFSQHLALSIPGLKQGYVWQLLTFQFLHGGLLHLLLNSIMIYFFGRALEEALGKAAFLKIYFVGGVVGGLLQMLASLLLPNHFEALPMVGASAGGFSLLAAFATLHPERPLTLLVAFIIPINMRAKYLLLLGGLLALFGALVPQDNIAHMAHIGGLLTGIAYIRWSVQSEVPLILSRRIRPRRRPSELAGVHSPKSSWQRVRNATREVASGDFISQEVDPILDKISAHGIQSLTPEERRILEAARAKMAKR